MKSLCLFCGSSDRVEDVYKEAAKSLGAYCATHSIRLVYGGARAGLMGIAADAALQGGGYVVGVMPEFLYEKEIGHKAIQELHMTDTMQQRQQMMADLADSFILLPGGIGSLAEFFEVLTAKSLALHKKPILVLNINGYWDNLRVMMNGIGQAGFLRSESEDLYTVVSSIDELNSFLH